MSRHRQPAGPRGIAGAGVNVALVVVSCLGGGGGGGGGTRLVVVDSVGLYQQKERKKVRARTLIAVGGLSI